ncbi:MAG: hypothetical protein ACOYOU_02810 [Kiritimatiellia bacterium]
MRKALWASARSIGGERFRGWVEQKHEKLSEKAGSREDVAFRRVRGVVGVEDVLRAAAGFCGMQHNDLFRPHARWNCARTCIPVALPVQWFDPTKSRADVGPDDRSGSQRAIADLVPSARQR